MSFALSHFLFYESAPLPLFLLGCGPGGEGRDTYFTLSALQKGTYKENYK